MDGTSLLQPMFETDTAATMHEQRTYSAAENAKVEERLRELGYFE